MSTDFPVLALGDGSGLEADPRIYPEELALAFRNKALPLEGLRHDITPVGMHYTLTHYDIPTVHVPTWRLRISGHVRTPRAVRLIEILSRPPRTMRVTLECAGDGRALLHPRPLSQPWLTGAVGTAEWTGTPLGPLLEEIGILEGAVDIVFTGADRGFEGGVEQQFQRSLSLAEAMNPDTMLVWAMNGSALEPQHGHPLRLIVPGWYGMASVKWLSAIEAVTTPFEGYQQKAYAYGASRESPGDPVTLMRVRSLMIPPGIPDFLTRTRIVPRGPVVVEGRAWSGRTKITRVEFSSDAGATWADANVVAGHPDEPHAWRSWSVAWRPQEPGPCDLVCRAHDESGGVQPLEPFWTARGMGNNMVHRVRVMVV